MFIVVESIPQPKTDAETFVEQIFAPIDSARASALAWIKGAMIAEAVRCASDVCSWCKLHRNGGHKVNAAVLVEGEWLHYDSRDGILGRCNAGPIHQRLYNQRAADKFDPKFPGFPGFSLQGLRLGAVGTQDYASAPVEQAGTVVTCDECHGGGKHRLLKDTPCHACDGTGKASKL